MQDFAQSIPSALEILVRDTSSKTRTTIIDILQYLFCCTYLDHNIGEKTKIKNLTIGSIHVMRRPPKRKVMSPIDIAGHFERRHILFGEDVKRKIWKIILL
jgi:hypothetical protein